MRKAQKLYPKEIRQHVLGIGFVLCQIHQPCILTFFPLATAVLTNKLASPGRPDTRANSALRTNREESSMVSAIRCRSDYRGQHTKPVLSTSCTYHYTQKEPLYPAQRVSHLLQNRRPKMIDSATGGLRLTTTPSCTTTSGRKQWLSMSNNSRLREVTVHCAATFPSSPVPIMRRAVD